MGKRQNQAPVVRLAADLDLPLEVVTLTIAVVAMRRAGKSYLARRLTEQLHHAGQQVVVVDLRVFAEVIGQAARFRLWFLRRDRISFVDHKHHGRAKGLSGLHSVKRFEERGHKCGDARMLGAAEDIVRRGGQRGIGCTLITQRSAVLNKNVLTQAQVLIALRTIGPQDLAAINTWIDVHGSPAERKTLMDSLPSLPIGDAWVWSPGWPTTRGIFSRIHTLAIETFDSGATPKPGKKQIEPKRVADVDLEAVRRQMAATIDRAKQDDPKELRKRISELEGQLQTAKQITTPKPERIEVPVLSEASRSALTEFVRASELLLSDVRAALRRFAPVAQVPALRPVGRSLPPKPAKAAARVVTAPAQHEYAAADDVGTGGLRRMLTALAQRPSGLSTRQIGVRAGLSSSSGTFSTYLSKARSRGWVAGSSSLLKITNEGLVALGPYEHLPTGAALLEHWISELGQSGVARLLRVVADVYPNAISNSEAAIAAGLSPSSGTFATYVGRLRSLELVYGRGELRANAELFDD